MVSRLPGCFCHKVNIIPTRNTTNFLKDDCQRETKVLPGTNVRSEQASISCCLARPQTGDARYHFREHGQDIIPQRWTQRALALKRPSKVRRAMLPAEQAHSAPPPEPNTPGSRHVSLNSSLPSVLQGGMLAGRERLDYRRSCFLQWRE
jgi:hypothetical protein